MSQEWISLLDADVIMLSHYGGPEVQAAFEAQPLFQQLTPQFEKALGAG